MPPMRKWSCSVHPMTLGRLHRDLLNHRLVLPVQRHCLDKPLHLAGSLSLRITVLFLPNSPRNSEMP